MLSVIIPTYNAAATRLPQALSNLAASPLVQEVIVVDGGSQDETPALVQHSNASFLITSPGRGGQLRQGAAAAKADWLLFLHADTLLQDDWQTELQAFMAAAESQNKAGYFTLAFDDRSSPMARWLEQVVAWRSRTFGLPYGDQALVIHRRLYDAIGGFEDIPLMEDVSLVRRLGKARLHCFTSRALTSAARYKKSGYLPRMLRNITCLSLYFLGASPQFLVRLYR